MNRCCPTCGVELVQTPDVVPYGNDPDLAFKLTFCSEACRDDYAEGVDG